MIKTNSSGAVTFQQNINHVNLSRVYVLTTKASASASELIINGLDPYINVIQVGKTTTGKYQASEPYPCPSWKTGYLSIS